MPKVISSFSYRCTGVLSATLAHIHTMNMKHLLHLFENEDNLLIYIKERLTIEEAERLLANFHSAVRRWKDDIKEEHAQSIKIQGVIKVCEKNNINPEDLIIYIRRNTKKNN